MDFCGMGFKFPNGESLLDVEFIASRWLGKEIVSNPFTRNDKPLKIAIFSHGMTIKCLLHWIMQFDHRMTWKIKTENTSISTVHLKNGEWFIESINDTSHLKESEAFQSKTFSLLKEKE